MAECRGCIARTNLLIRADAEVERLRADVARLTQERDEARAAVEAEQQSIRRIERNLKVPSITHALVLRGEIVLSDIYSDAYARNRKLEALAVRYREALEDVLSLCPSQDTMDALTPEHGTTEVRRYALHPTHAQIERWRAVLAPEPEER